MAQPAWDAPDVPSGDHLSYLDDRTARVVDPTGTVQGLVVSSLPMRSQDDGGHDAPVDLGLADQGATLEPANPLVPLAVHQNLQGGVELGDTGITLVPSGAQAAASGVPDGAVAFFANAGTDTDFVVKPVPSGFETFTLLRSADSPEQLSFNFQLPAGVEAQVSSDQQRVEFRRGEAVVASVGVPSAYDADGTEVATSWSLAGSTIHVTVSHHAPGTVYPVIVDPVVDYYDWEQGTSDSTGWAFSNPSGADFSGLFGTWFNGRGLYIRTMKSLLNLPWSSFSSGQQAAWTFSAPGSSRIVQVEWNLVNHDIDLPLSRTCLQLGIAQSATTGAPWEPGAASSLERCGYVGFPLTPLGGGVFTTTVGSSPGGDPAQAHPGNAARFAVKIATGSQIGYFMSQVGGAYVHLQDSDAPTITEDDVPSAWGAWPTTRQVSVSAHDAGLGIKSAALSASGWSVQAGTAQVPPTCTQTVVCAHDYAYRAAGGTTPTVGNLPEGDDVLTASASDPAGHTTTRQIHVRIDRTPPDLSLSGELYDRRAEALAPATYNLVAAASDQNATHATSGVQQLTVSVDGQSVPGGQSVSQSCPAGSCNLSHTFALDLSGLAGGSHDLAVTATDAAGLVTTRHLTLTFTRARTSLLPATFSLTPALQTTLEGGADQVLPGQPVPYRARVRNSGSALALGASLRVDNLTGAGAQVAAYVAAIERRTGSGGWTVVAARAAALPGYTAHDSGPGGTALTVGASGQPAAGASYPATGDRILGTTLSAGSSGTWQLAASSDLDSAAVTALASDAANGQVRVRVHVELADSGLHASGESESTADITADTRTQSAVARHAQLQVTGFDGATSTITDAQQPTLATIAPGADALIPVDQQTPGVAAKATGESDLTYLTRLAGADATAFSIAMQTSAQSDGASTRDGSGTPQTGAPRTLGAPQAHDATTRRLPIVAVAKSGPPGASAGTEVQYTVTAANSGSAAATITSLTDQVDSGQPVSVPGAPTTLAAGASASAQVPYDIPTAHATGPLSDTATVQWADARGNQYGPVSDHYTTQVQATSGGGVSAPTLDTTIPTNLADATRFLYQGPGAIQSGVQPGAIPAVRAAVVRGKVLDAAGQALPGVTISAPGHAEYGTTTSRSDGEIYYAVAGGGPLTIRLTKAGYLPVERTVNVPWNDYVFLDQDVRLTALDPQVSPVSLGVLSPEQVALGSQVSDQDGTRRSAVIFPADEQASLQMPDGSLQPVTSLHVRQTEYTVGPSGREAMPAELPTSSGYTYAVEFSADEAQAAGATSVQFTRPVSGYVDNFLGFPVGTPVPAGYYDRASHTWVAEPDGRVIKILATTGGHATLDVDGSGNAATSAQLADLGIDNAELDRLAGMYSAGQSVWRVQMTHFSLHDWNWAFKLPLDAFVPAMPLVRALSHLIPNPCHHDGSDIECENQTLGEDYPLTGVAHALDYRSSRQPGRVGENDTLDIPATPASIPSSLAGVRVDVQVAGRDFSYDVAPHPDQHINFTWDGKDAFGRRLQGKQPVTIRTTYEYPAVYGTSSAGGTGGVTSFGRGGDVGVGINARANIELTTDRTTSLGGFDARLASDALGGWTLDSHDTYDAASRTLYGGDGSERTTTSVNRVVKPFATLLNNANTPIAAGPDGSIYAINGPGANQVFRITPDGTAHLLAGQAQYGFSGDAPTPAAQAQFAALSGIALGPDGSVYVSDPNNGNRVRRIGPDGIVTTVAGGGSGSGESGAATDAALLAPAGLTVAPDGTLYIACLGYAYSGWGGKIMRVTPDGQISRVAGRADGFSPDETDHIPATQSGLYQPTDVALTADGSLLIADSAHNKIRRVAPDGTITTIAGGGTQLGDGGPATSALVAGPSTVDVGPDGSIYIGQGTRIRRVLTDGSITTLAGTGQPGYQALQQKNMPATQVAIGAVRGLAPTPDGSVVFADGESGLLRITTPMPGFSDQQLALPSADGQELYRFDAQGRHLSTVDALTGAAVETFAYDSAGRLLSSTDGDGNQTRIERDPDGNATAIVAPDGQRTALTQDAQGDLSSLSDPAGDTVQLDYAPGGLLQRLTDPRGHSHQFTYDPDGRLASDTDPVGASTSLARTTIDDHSGSVSTSSTLGRTSTHRYSQADDGTIQRTSTDSAGLQSTSAEYPDGSTQATAPDGTTATSQLSPDPRFGMQAPFTGAAQTTSPGGVQVTTSQSRTAQLTNPDDPLSLTGLTVTSSIGSDIFTTRFDKSSLTFTTTSAESRSSTTQVDSQ
ncbi:MAG TPA: hypothetical protein VMT10_08380, partial [Solirubrobacteraceae bacterium]|nr:hypothetical protein [Solirubrobacteraceae bacterium]